MLSTRLRSYAVAGLIGFLTGPASAQDILPAPYQVEGLVSYREPYLVEFLTRYPDAGATAGTLDGPFVVVDLGGARNRPPPLDEMPGVVTIVGTGGHVQAVLHDLVRSCEHPCGPSDGEACHFSAQYRPEAPVAAAGTPLIAIPGRHDLDGFRRASGRPGALASLAPDLSSALWDDQHHLGLRDWSGQDRQVTVTSDIARLDGIRWSDCSVNDHGELQTLQCGLRNGAWLSDGRPLLVSMEQGVLQLLAWFDADGRSYAVVQRGYTVGLVVRKAGQWQGRARRAGHTLTCS